MGIPAIAGADPQVLDIPDGTATILDGTKGALRINISPPEMERTRQRIANQAAKREAALNKAFEPAITRDGYRVEVVANITNIEYAKEASKLGA